MTPFDPLRDFFQPRHAAQLDAQASQLHLVIERSEAKPGNFVFPGLDITATIQYQGQRIGRVDYGVSPLDDRLYISRFEIDEAHRGQGLGVGALWRLSRQHAMPLATLHEVGTSVGFWSKVAREFAAAGIDLQRDIRTAEHTDIQARWAHLIPESEVDRSTRAYWQWVKAERAARRPAGPGIR